MPILHFTEELPCSAQEAWAMFRQPAHLQKISMPLLKIVAMPPVPSGFAPGVTLATKLYLFGFLPWGAHTIHFQRWNEADHSFETREQGGAVRNWNHRSRIEAVSPTSCRCIDEIHFDAGLMNGFVWCFSQLLYRLRYRRWRRIVVAHQSSR